MIPTVTLLKASIRIKYGDTLHFYCKRSDLISINSWKWNEASGEPTSRFCIEYIFIGTSVTCEYDTEKHWKVILAGLEAIL